MPLAIRDALPADLPAILAITNDAIRNTTAVWSEEPATLEARTAWLAGRQAAGLPVLVAALDGTAAGFASFAQFRPWPGYAESVEHSIYVAPGYQGQGIGTALLAALIGRARAMGMHAMLAGIDGGNAGSIAFHARAGFVEVGRLPEVGRKFGRRLDLVFMQKLLG